MFSVLDVISKKKLNLVADIDWCTSGDCMSTPFSLWVALDVFLVLIATVLVVYGEVTFIVGRTSLKMVCY